MNSVTKKQTIKPKQVVIVKDGPVETDIDKIVNTIKQDNPSIQFDVISNIENKGLAFSLNEGAKAIKTEWIARMDSDDISVNDRFSKQVSFLVANHEIDILGGFTEEFENNPGDLQRIRKVPTTHKDIVKSLRKRNALNHPTVMFRRKAFESVGGYSTDFGKMEDYKLWIDFLLNGFVFANLDCVLVNMRVGNGFLNRRSNKEEIRDWKKLQTYLKNNKIISWLKMKKISLFLLFCSFPTLAKENSLQKNIA